MEDYIATFFSHFGAMAFKKKCDKERLNEVFVFEKG